MGVADVLIQRGWTQGVTEREDGSVCLSGAMAVACGWRGGELMMDSEQVAQYDRMLKAFYARTGTPMAVHRWNDAWSRTYDEVLRAAKEIDEELDL